MKNLKVFAIFFGVYVSTSLGAWTYVITSGYHGGYSLTGEQSLLMTGGGDA